MENPVEGQFIGCVLAFKSEGDCEEVCRDYGMLEVTDSGGGFAEVAFNYGDERVYLAFRMSDLVRAVKEKSTP